MPICSQTVPFLHAKCQQTPMYSSRILNLLIFWVSHKWQKQKRINIYNLDPYLYTYIYPDIWIHTTSVFLNNCFFLILNVVFVFILNVLNFMKFRNSGFLDLFDSCFVEFFRCVGLVFKLCCRWFVLLFHDLCFCLIVFFVFHGCLWICEDLLVDFVDVCGFLWICEDFVGFCAFRGCLWIFVQFFILNLVVLRCLLSY